jgi:hypothetical protein
MRTATDSRLRLALLCLLLGIYLLVYIPQISSADGEAILAVAAATVRHGTPDIGVFGASDALFAFDRSRMGTFGADGAYYSKKGVVPSVALIPLLLLGLYNWARFGSPFSTGCQFAAGEGQQPRRGAAVQDERLRREAVLDARDAQHHRAAHVGWIARRAANRTAGDR